jgi:hypothetical protein
MLSACSSCIVKTMCLEKCKDILDFLYTEERLDTAMRNILSRYIKKRYEGFSTTITFRFTISRNSIKKAFTVTYYDDEYISCRNLTKKNSKKKKWK